ncbi:peritrophin-48 [Drosophila busckii]|uniref:peritrophin-48 n=1 Tax=Drosophila busckii TaxID=30019 RepID=UPI00083ED143|nr:peritrophin-48 [Drosophila busckii]
MQGLGLLLALVALASASSKISEFEYLSSYQICDLVPDDTSLLRPNTCNHWIRCPINGSSLEEGSCAAELNYNKNQGRCVSASSVECPYAHVNNSMNQAANVCANQIEGSFLEDPTSPDCRGYILCRQHRVVKANCPNELIFNAQSRSCVYPTQYTCPASQRTTSPACRALPNNTRLAHEEHCNSYYICINDLLHERECLDQMAYDVRRGRCVPAANATCYETAKLPPPENTFCVTRTQNQTKNLVGHFPDPESCSHYYICGKPVNGKHDTNPQHLQCDPGQFYDQEKLSCRDRLNVRCPLDRCAGTDLNYVNVLGNCHNYMRCSNGVAVGNGTCPSSYYFDERSQGCTPVNHNYAACAV